MISTNCKICGCHFEISDSEISFFKSHNLALPKTCPNCRKNLKKMKKKNVSVKACSTCYFRGPVKKFDAHDVYPDSYHLYGMAFLKYHRCNYSNRAIVNDAPCEHWAPKNKKRFSL